MHLQHKSKSQTSYLFIDLDEPLDCYDPCNCYRWDKGYARRHRNKRPNRG